MAPHIRTLLRSFDRLVKDNICANDLQRSQLNSLLSEVVANREDLNNEIKDLESLIKAKRRQDEELSQLFWHYNCVNAPIRRLPQDILSQIFLFCLPADDFPCIADCAQAPLLLTRICKLWRTIAMQSTPRLWSSIRIPLDNTVAPPRTPVFTAGMDKMHRIEQWLRRSGSLPIDISISSIRSVTRSSEYTGNHGKLMDPILNHADRLRTLYLPSDNDWANQGSLLRYLSTHTSGKNLSALETLRITSHGGLRYGSLGLEIPEINSKRIAVLQTPVLRNLKLDLFDAEWRILPVHWGQLTSLHLTVRDHDVHRIFPPGLPRSLIMSNVLESCTSLIRCELRLSSVPDRLHITTLPYRRIVLPHLETLLLDDGGCDLTGWLKNFEVPVLREFEYLTLKEPVTARFAPSSPESTRLSSFMTKISSTLRKFQTSTSSFTQTAQLVESLRHCTSLQTLILDPEVDSLYGPKHSWESKIIDDRFIQLLAKNSDVALKEFKFSTSFGAFLPALEELRLPSQTTFLDKSLLSFILFKQTQPPGSAVSKLRHLSATVAGLTQVDFKSQIEAKGGGCDGLELVLGIKLPEVSRSNSVSPQQKRAPSYIYKGGYSGAGMHDFLARVPDREFFSPW